MLHSIFSSLPSFIVLSVHSNILPFSSSQVFGGSSTGSLLCSSSFLSSCFISHNNSNNNRKVAQKAVWQRNKNMERRNNKIVTYHYEDNVGSVNCGVYGGGGGDFGGWSITSGGGRYVDLGIE